MAPINNTAQSPEQEQVLQKAEQCYLTAEAYLGQQFVRPEISFDLRGKSAGTAHLNTNKLRFNPVLLKENQTIFLQEVVAHEICHLLTYQLCGKVRPHGKEWQALMLSVFNLTPSTTHNLDTSSVAGKQFDYHCHCGLVKLSVRRHNKVIRGETQYRCRRCQQQLQSTPLR